MKRIALLKNSIQEYSWGSHTFIPELFGEPTPSDKPQAELWMGAHSKAVSRVLCPGKEVPLSDWIQNDPEEILGPSCAKKFNNTLPFLFKVLAASKPLSIQAHPNKIQALKGFEKENRLKIPLNDPHRNYIDDNHKPELICALRPLTALKGFRSVSEIIKLMEKMEAPVRELGLDLLMNLPSRDGLRKFFYHLMTIPWDLQRDIVNRVVENAEKRFTGPDSLIEWMIRLNEGHPGDIGVLSPLFLNLVQLQPQEALFIPEGELHAYLEGVGLEIMANSDNVLRGGLTPKHMDVSELCNILNFEESHVEILTPEIEETGEGFFRTSVAEFMLSIIFLGKDMPYKSAVNRSVEIMICIDVKGCITDLGNGDSLNLSKGISFIIPATVRHYQIDGRGTIYKASVPL